MSELTREQVLEYDGKYNQHPWLTGNVDAVPIERADGIYFWDYNGKKYYDMSSQLANVNLGYGNKDITEAVKSQIEKLPYIAPALASGPRSELAKLLIELAPGNMEKVFFTCGGSDANEAAVYAARTFTGRNKVFSRYRSYHGSTLGSANLSGDPRRFALERPAANGFIKFFDPYVYRSEIDFKSDKEASEYYLGLLEDQIQYEGPDQIAAIEVESITGANGVIIPPDGYLRRLRALCDKYGILLICDEVMAGFGRTGKMFAFENWGIKPDIISFAKGVTCGYVQLGGIIISSEIADYFKDKVFQYGLTYSGHSLAYALVVVTAVPLGLLSGYNSKVRAVLEPIIEFYRPLPPLAYYTILVLWMGIDESSKLALLYLAGFAPIYIACVSGVMRIRADYINGAYTLGANKRQIFFYVIFPAALTDIFTGLRTALGVEYTTLVAAEMVAATAGMGWLVLDASNYLRSDIVFMGVIIMGITGILLDKIIRILENRIVYWKGKA